MANLYLNKIGLNNATEVHFYNDVFQRFETVRTYRLSIPDLVSIWRKCFDIDKKETIFLYMSQKLIDKTVYAIVDLFAKQNVKCYPLKERKDFNLKIF